MESEENKNKKRVKREKKEFWSKNDNFFGRLFCISFISSSIASVAPCSDVVSSAFFETVVIGTALGGMRAGRWWPSDGPRSKGKALPSSPFS